LLVHCWLPATGIQREKDVRPAVQHRPATKAQEEEKGAKGLALRLCVVGSSGDSGITGLGDILDHDLGTSVASNSDPSRSCSDAARNLEEVVGCPGGGDPCLARVNRDLHLGSTAVGVDDLSGEPILRDTTLHVDLEVALDRARDVFPADINDASGSGSKLGESVLEEVEMVRSTAWALVDDLSCVR